MKDWRRPLRYNPAPALSSSKSRSLLYFVSRDILGKVANEEVEETWQCPEVEAMLRTQMENGAWKYHGARESIRSQDSYDQMETYRILARLVEKHGLNRKHPAIKKAAEYLFSRQSKEGDFLRLAGNQYTPYYSGAAMELLIKAGYSEDPRIERGFRWLLLMQQEDGGWAFPMRTLGMKLGTETFRAKTVKPDKSKPFSHLVTGMVLRAFAAHPKYRDSEDAHVAGQLLASRFFESDKYPDRQGASFWTSFSYPFWFTDLLSSLDSLSQIGFSSQEAQVQKALNWLIGKQGRSGLWSLRLRTMAGEEEADSWISLAICRVFRRMFD